jgi:hypothetical protein
MCVCVFFGGVSSGTSWHTYWLCSLCQLWQSSHQKNVKIWNVSWSSQKKKWTQKQTLDWLTSKCERHVRPNEIYIDPWSNPWRQDCQSIDNHSHVGVFVSSSHGNGHLNFLCWAFNVWKVHYCEHLAPLTNPPPPQQTFFNAHRFKSLVIKSILLEMCNTFPHGHELGICTSGFFKQISACS